MYIIHLNNGKKYVGISKNMHRRIGQHVNRSKGALRREGLGAADINHISHYTFSKGRNSWARMRRLEKRTIRAFGGPSRGRGTLYNRSY